MKWYVQFFNFLYKYYGKINYFCFTNYLFLLFKNEKKRFTFFILSKNKIINIELFTF